MKIHQTQYDLTWMIYIPFFLGLSLLFYFDAKWLALGTSFHWFFSPLLVFAFLSRSWRDHFIYYTANQKTKRSSQIKTILFSAALACLFKASASLLQPSLHPAPYHFFPFDFFALFTIVMARLQNADHKGLLSSAVQFWFGDQYNQGTGELTDSYARITNLLCLSCTAFIVALMLLTMVTHFTTIAPISGLSSGTALGMCATLIIMNSSAFRTSMRTMINVLPLPIIVPIGIVLVVIFNLAIATIINSQLSHDLMHIDFFQNWQSASNHTILYNMFLASWGLLYCGVICHCAQGQSVRTTLLSSLGTVLVTNLILMRLNVWSVYGLATIGAIGLLTNLVRRDVISHISRATMLSESWFKPRAPYNYVSSVVVLCAVFFGSYLTFDATVISYLMLLATLPTMSLMTFSFAQILLLTRTSARRDVTVSSIT